MSENFILKVLLLHKGKTHIPEKINTFSQDYNQIELRDLGSKFFVHRLSFLGSVNIILQTFTSKSNRLKSHIGNKNLDKYYSFEFYEVYPQE